MREGNRIEGLSDHASEAVHRLKRKAFNMCVVEDCGEEKVVECVERTKENMIGKLKAFSKVFGYGPYSELKKITDLSMEFHKKNCTKRKSDISIK